MNFKFSAISHNGSIGYISYQQNFVNKIGSYNLTGANISLIGTFNNCDKTINPTKLCVTDQYLISYSSSYMTVDYFNLSSLSWAGRFNLTEYPNSMTFLSSKKLVISTSTSGNIKSFTSNLSSTMTFITISTGLLNPVYVEASPLENYISVGDNSNKLRIYSLATNTLLFMTSNSSGGSCQSMAWNKD